MYTYIFQAPRTENRAKKRLLVQIWVNFAVVQRGVCRPALPFWGLKTSYGTRSEGGGGKVQRFFGNRRWREAPSSYTHVCGMCLGTTDMASRLGSHFFRKNRGF